MLLSIPNMTARADKVHITRDNETETWRSDYTERAAHVPQLLLVEQPIPGSKILSHFHGVDQFQVVVGGSGKLGQHAVGPISLHYTNRGLIRRAVADRCFWCCRVRSRMATKRWLLLHRWR